MPAYYETVISTPAKPIHIIRCAKLQIMSVCTNIAIPINRAV